MNEDRRQRRITLLAEMFYELQARHLGKTNPAKPSSWDIDAVASLLDPDGSEQATFAEAKAVLVWVFTDPSGLWWTDVLTSAKRFVAKFAELCDQYDKSIPPWWRAAPGVVVAPATQPVPDVGEPNPDPWRARATTVAIAADAEGFDQSEVASSVAAPDDEPGGFGPPGPAWREHAANFDRSIKCPTRQGMHQR